MRRFLFALVLLCALPVYAQAPPVPLAEQVVKLPVEEGVSLDQAIESMKLRANMLNMPLVGEMPLSAQVKAMGEDSRRIEIFQFCNPLTAKDMVQANIDFVAFLPCRIAVVEDEQGQGWLVMADLNRILAGAELPAELQERALAVRDALDQIMHAGANGEL